MEVRSEVHKLGRFVVGDRLKSIVVDEALDKRIAQKLTILDSYHGASVLTIVTQKPLIHLCTLIISLDFAEVTEVVCLNLNERIQLVNKELEGAIPELKRRWTRQLCSRRVEGVEIEEHFVTLCKLRVRLAKLKEAIMVGLAAAVCRVGTDCRIVVGRIASLVNGIGRLHSCPVEIVDTFIVKINHRVNYVI